MACATLASARANNHSKTTQSLTTQRNYATTTTPFVRVSTFVYRMISHHVPSPMAASRSLMFPNGSHTHTRRFQRKTVPLANIQEPQPFHHLPRTRHRNFQPRAQKKAKHDRRPASKKALTRVDSARANLLGLVCHGHQHRMNCSQKGGLVYAVSGISAKRRQTRSTSPSKQRSEEEVRSYRAHYQSWINTIERVGQ